jgi:hypothetical protein
MKKWLVLMLISVGLLGASGCGTAGRSYVDTGMTETLEVEILPDASKMFTYRLRWPEDNIPNHIQIARDGNKPGKAFARGGIEMNRATYDRLMENTAYVVERTAYCREGFFELDRSISRYHLWIRGECKESASEEDRKVFTGKQTLTEDRWRKH